MRTRGERLSLLKSFLVRGFASGSERARRSTSSSKSFRRASQSVLSCGRLLRLKRMVPMVILARTASRNGDRFADCFGRDAPQALLAPVLQYKGDGFRQALSSFLLGLSLTVCTRDLRAIGDEPPAVSFNDRRELIP